MDKVRVFFWPENRSVATDRGTNLLALMQAEGIAVDAVCGGRGICGKCLVRIDGELHRACSIEVNTDLKVEYVTGTSDPVMPISESLSKTDRNALPTSYLKGDLKGDLKNDQIESSDNTYFDPQIRVLFEAGEWRVVYGDRILKRCEKTPKAYMAAVDIGTTTVAAYLIDASEGRLQAAAALKNPQGKFGADVISRADYALRHAERDSIRERAPDYSIHSSGIGKIPSISKESAELVIGSAEDDFSGKTHDGGDGVLTECIRRAVRSLIADLAEEAGAKTEEIYAVSVAGNTCMHHFFFGLPVNTLVQSPYVPSQKAAMIISAGEILGDAVNPNALLFALPNLAGFVGGDTAACLISARLKERKEWTLILDIGTNGEMALAKNGRVAVCSTAAGPAFEGAGISCGMRAEEGAILHVSKIDEVTEKKAASQTSESASPAWEYEVMGGGVPRGICGSGLLDIVALLLKEGRIDTSGRFTEESEVVLYPSGIIAAGSEKNSCPAAKISKSEKNSCPAAKISKSENNSCSAAKIPKSEKRPDEEITISLTQRDVSQLQFAKAAIAAGIHLLAKHMGIEVCEISEVLLAGAFGNFLDPESACAIGLIPPVLEGRIRPIGNAAGDGAMEVLRDRRAWEYGTHLPDQVEHLELAMLLDFQEIFIRELQFPDYRE